MIVWCFDVDETLSVGRPPGPIDIIELLKLRKDGHIVGICGNWGQFVKSVKSWGMYVDFITPIAGSHDKRPYLEALRVGIDADDYVLVGNIGGVSGSTDEKQIAEDTGWRFIKESDFAAGAR